MLETIFISLGVLSVLFMILAILWKSLTFSVIDTILWLIMAISVYNIERPFQYVQGNTIVTTTHIIEGTYHLAPLFILFAIIMMIHTWQIAFDLLKGRKPKLM